MAMWFNKQNVAGIPSRWDVTGTPIVDDRTPDEMSAISSIPVPEEVGTYAAMPAPVAAPEGNSGGVGNILKSILGGALDGVAAHYGFEGGYSSGLERKRKLSEELQQAMYKAQIEDAQRQRQRMDGREDKQWEWTNKPKDLTEYGQALVEQGLQPGSPEFTSAMGKYNARRADPIVTTTLPGDRFYSGPSSGLPSALGGMGGGASGPPPEAIADLKRNPASAAQFDEVFGAGAAARVLGGGVGNGPGNFRP